MRPLFSVGMFVFSRYLCRTSKTLNPLVLRADPFSVGFTEKYEKEAGKNWDLFYKRNADRVREPPITTIISLIYMSTSMGCSSRLSKSSWHVLLIYFVMFRVWRCLLLWLRNS